MLSFEIIIDWLQAALRWAAPLIIVSVGEIYSERSGVVNMGIEGIMLFGALIGVGVSYYMNSLILAVVFLLVCMKVVRVLRKLFIRFYMLEVNLVNQAIKSQEDYMVLVLVL